MSTKTKTRWRSHWSLTLILSLVVLGVFMVVIPAISLVGLAAVKQGSITATSVLENPSAMISVICVVSFVLGVVLMLVIHWLLIRPMRRMTRALGQLAKGEFNTRLEPARYLQPQEVRNFNQSFNATAEHLSSVEILRSDFVNNFSHEFKTPIHSLVGMAELLKSGDLSPEETAEYLDIFIDQTKRLSALATNLLGLSKLETNTDIPPMAKINLSETLRQVLLLYDHICNEKEISLATEIEPVEYYGNSELLARMMSNLLDNAIKFSAANAQVTVSLRRVAATKQHPSWVVFRVADNGVGMDELTKSRIFEKFYQGDTSHQTTGFGLGLAMVKKIVELHHGEIKVNSSLGRGAVFEIRLGEIIDLESDVAKN